jgi:3-keto-5-aminohexanoate cleavage enzyme
MKTNKNKPTLSRRDFVIAAVGLGGMSATLLAGESPRPAPAETAQEGAQRASSGASGLMNKLIVTVTPSGADPHDPTHFELANDPKRHADAIMDAFHAGASIVHIRGAVKAEKNPDPLRGRAPEFDSWKEVTELVRSRCNIMINYGLSAMQPAVRKPLFALKPEAASFLVGHHYSGLPVLPDFQREAALNHLEAGVLPEVEVFHTGDMANWNALIKTGLLRPPYCVTLFFEYQPYYPVPPTVTLLQGLLSMMPENAHWTLNVKGPKHLDMAAQTIALGGHVRTGLENGVELSPGRYARTQAECVERIVQLAKSLGREIATPDEARQILGLPRKPEKITA